MAEIRVEIDDWMGNDLKVCRMAKDSFGRTTDWVNGEVGNLSTKDQRLLKMLARGMGEDEYQETIDAIGLAASRAQIEAAMWKFRHTTPHLAPFGHCFATFKFKAPVFVMRQVVKHEYLRISELSMRYVRGMPEYFRPKSWRTMAEDVKQGSGGDMHVDEQGWLNDLMDGSFNEDQFDYEKMIRSDVAPEQARMFLRLCHMTEGHFSGSMDAIAGLVIKRLDPHAQEETREFARQVDKQMAEIYPLAWAALTEGVVR